MIRHWDAELVRQRRRELGLRQADVADELSVQRTTVAAWEAGDHPQLRHAGALADLLGVPLDQIYVHGPEADTASTGDGTKPPHTGCHWQVIGVGPRQEG